MRDGCDSVAWLYTTPLICLTCPLPNEYRYQDICLSTEERLLWLVVSSANMHVLTCNAEVCLVHCLMNTGSRTSACRQKSGWLLRSTEQLCTQSRFNFLFSCLPCPLPYEYRYQDICLSTEERAAAMERRAALAEARCSKLEAAARDSQAATKAMQKQLADAHQEAANAKAAAVAAEAAAGAAKAVAAAQHSSDEVARVRERLEQLEQQLADQVCYKE